MRKDWRRSGTTLALLALAVASCTSGSTTSTSSPGATAATSSISQIPSGTGSPPYVASFPDTTLANCGPGSVPETGLQGQVPLAVRQSGFKGFSCNLQLQSKYSGDGAEWVGTWYGHCFYMSTASGPKQTKKGVQVVDVSDPSNATFTMNLDAPGTLNTWEGLRTTSSGLLIGYQVASTPGMSLSGNWISIYNIKNDCAHPTLLSSVQVGPPGSGHEGEVSPDGKTFYVGTTQTLRSDPNPPGGKLGLLAIDIADPANPKLLTSWYIPINTGCPTKEAQATPYECGPVVHGVGISADGKIGYLVNLDRPPNPGANGLMIVDLSQVQERKPNPQISIISTFFYADNTTGQMAEEFKLAGHPNRTYIVLTDENGSGTYDPKSGTYNRFWPATCNGRAHPFAFGRIIDVTDPRVPTQIGQLKIQVQDPKNCPAILNDSKPGTSGGYNMHYCGVDNPQKATAIACGEWQSGIRVFDIRDPYNPKEIAYYNPPPNPANASGGGLDVGGAYDPDPTADWATSWSEFYKAADGSWNLIIQTQENGVQVLKFMNGVYPLPGGSNVSTPPPY